MITLATTPFYLVHEDALIENINTFKAALAAQWPNSILSYSVKTNSLPWILKKVLSEGLYAEVVSDEEYELALLCGFDDSDIVFNGPIKGEECIKSALEGGAIVNLDSRQDLKYVQQYAREKSTVGIRVNVPLSLFPSEEVYPYEGGFRFGFSDEENDLEDALKVVSELKKGVKIGLHLHCNSKTRSLAVYQTIARYVAHLVKKYDLGLDFLDFGGGYFGGVEGMPSAHEYISVIAEELRGTVDPAKTCLIVEPGCAIVGSAVDLVTSVVDEKKIGGVKMVTTDGSRLHIDPLWKKERYRYEIQSSSGTFDGRQVICGYTCMDLDRLMTIEGQKELKVGDKIVYQRVGAYGMTLGGMFIRYLPAVLVEKQGGGIDVARSEITAEMYKRINS